MGCENTAQELIEYKESAIAELHEYVENNIKRYWSEDVWNTHWILTKWQERIHTAENADMVDTYLADAKQALNEQIVAIKYEMRMHIRNHSENIRENVYDLQLEDWTAIKEIIEESCVAINAANSYDEMNTIVENAQQAMDAIEITITIENQLLNKIKNDYMLQYDSSFAFYRFYGFYNGAAVFFLLDQDNNAKEVNISGVYFSYFDSDWTILVYKEDMFYNLEDIDTLIEAGILTQADVEAIGDIHNRPETEWAFGLGSYDGMDCETELQLRKNRFQKFPSISNYDPISFYYGNYNGYIVYQALDMMWYDADETIGDLHFSYPLNLGRIMVFKDGENNTLTSLCAIITSQELEDIYVRYTTKYYFDSFLYYK